MAGCNPNSHIQKLALKLKRLKSVIKEWRVSVSSAKGGEKKSLTDRLEVLDQLLESGSGSKPV